MTNNHIEEYLNSQESNKGSELFRIDEKNIDIKTEVSEEELRLIDVLISNDAHLKSKGIKRVFRNYYKNFLRLKVSLDRKGRREYVEINKSDNSDELIGKFGNLGNMLNSRK